MAIPNSRGTTIPNSRGTPIHKHTWIAIPHQGAGDNVRDGIWGFGSKLYSPHSSLLSAYTPHSYQQRVIQNRKMKVLRMRFSILENVPTSDDIIFMLFLASQLPYMYKSNKSDKI